MRTYPFTFPEFTEEDELGQQTVSYPVYHTEGLFPHLEQHPRTREEYPNLTDRVVPPLTAKKRKEDMQQAPRGNAPREPRKKRKY